MGLGVKSAEKLSKITQNDSKNSDLVKIEPILPLLVEKRGRPTKFHAGVAGLTDEYINECLDRGIIPTMEGLAGRFGVEDDTLVEWRNPKYTKMAKERKIFSASCKKLMQAQREMLVKHGLFGNYNTAMAIFILKNNHGFTDRHEVDYTTDGEKITGINYLNPADPKPKTPLPK
jgi:hypothetical protein